MQYLAHDISRNGQSEVSASARASGKTANTARSGIDVSQRIAEQKKRQRNAFGPAVQRKSNIDEATRYRTGQSAYTNRTGLPDEVKTNMEAGFKTDFSDVRIHTNSQSALKVNARAFTQGSHIHFAPGHFDPATGQGRQIIGHELAHVIQQQQGRVRPTGAVAGIPVNEDAALEKEADVMGTKLHVKGK